MYRLHIPLQFDQIMRGEHRVQLIHHVASVTTAQQRTFGVAIWVTQGNTHVEPVEL